MFLLRKILIGALAAATLAIILPAHADDLRFAHFMSTKHPLHDAVFVPLANQFGEATSGKVTIRIYPGGELGKGPVKQYDRVIDSIADIAFVLSGYTTKQFEKTLLVELPGIIAPGANPTERIWANIDLLKKDYRRTKLLGLWTNHETVLLTRNKPIRSLKDLKGLKIRVPSKYAGLVAAAWGASPVSMPITEVYTSMETGVIDGVFVDPSVLHSFKLGDVTKYVTTGMNASYTVFALLMNRGSWDGLSAERQTKLIELTGKETSLKASSVMVKAAKQAIASWVDDGGELIELSPNDAAEFNVAGRALTLSVINDQEADGIKARSFGQALGK